MRIDTKYEVINNRFKEELGMWRSIGNYNYPLSLMNSQSTPHLESNAGAGKIVVVI